MAFYLRTNTAEHQTLFQSGLFVVGLLSQTLIVMTLVVMRVGIALPFTPLATYLSLQPLPLSYFPWLVAILVGYMTLTQLVKGIYTRRYGWQ